MNISPVLRCAGLVVSFAAVSLSPAIPLYATDAELGLPAPAQPGPKLTVEQPSHDFGTVAQGQSLRHEFKITNTGDSVLEIHDVQPTCGCTTAGDWTRTLKPGESGTIPLKLETAQFMGPVTKSVTVTSNDAAKPESILTLKATIWTPITFSSPVLALPPITDVNEPARGSVIIRNERDVPMKLSDLGTENPLFKPELKELIPGKEFELVVTTAVPFPERTQAGKITMKSSVEQMPEVAVPVVATVLPAIQIAPTELTFTESKLPAAEKRFVAVISHRGANLAVTDLSINAPEVQIATTTTPDRKQVTITLNFPAGMEINADKAYFLRGKTNHPGAPTFQIPLVFVGN